MKIIYVFWYIDFLSIPVQLFQFLFDLNTQADFLIYAWLWPAAQKSKPVLSFTLPSLQSTLITLTMQASVLFTWCYVTTHNL